MRKIFRMPLAALLLLTSACADQANVGRNDCADDTRCQTLQLGALPTNAESGISTRRADLVRVTPNLHGEVAELAEASDEQLRRALLAEARDGGLWAALAHGNAVHVYHVDASGELESATPIAPPSDDDGARASVQSVFQSDGGALLLVNWLDSDEAPQELISISHGGYVTARVRLTLGRAPASAQSAFPSADADSFLLLYSANITRVSSEGKTLDVQGFGGNGSTLDLDARALSSGAHAFITSFEPTQDGLIRTGVVVVDALGELDIRSVGVQVLDGDVAADDSTSLVYEDTLGDAIVATIRDGKATSVMIERDDYLPLSPKFVGTGDHLFLTFRAGPREETEQYAGACRVAGAETRCFWIDGPAQSLMARDTDTLFALSPEGVVRYDVPRD